MTPCILSGNVKIKIYTSLPLVLYVYVEGSLNEGCEYLDLKRSNNRTGPRYSYIANIGVAADLTFVTVVCLAAVEGLAYIFRVP